MKLYLVRHCDALSRDAHPKRPLSEQGLLDAIKMAAFLFDADVLVHALVHSGKARAEQTANVLSKTVWLGRAALQWPHLGPHDAPDALIARALSAKGDLMVVGHMPFMARMVEHCLRKGGNAESPHDIDFEPGTVVCLHRQNTTPDQPRWTRAWVQHPSALADIAFTAS